MQISNVMLGIGYGGKVYFLEIMDFTNLRDFEHEKSARGNGR